MIRFLKNIKGFSLVEVMIAVGISGVVALGAAKLMSDNYKNQAYIETIAEVNKTMALAQTIFAKKENCTAFFQMNAITRGTTLPTAPSAIQYIMVNNVKFLDVNAHYGKYTVKNIIVKDSLVNARIKDIEFTFDWQSRPFMSTVPITKIISVFAEPQTQADGVARSTDAWACGGVVEDSKQEGQQALCASLGADFATWDSVAGKCNINTFQCPAGQVPYKVTSLGKVLCRQTQDMLDPYTLIDGSPVACPASNPNIRIIFDGTRYRLECSAACTPVVNGGWSAWSGCPPGVQVENRTCTNPAPSCGGTVCPGATSRPCNCTPTTSCAILRAGDCPGGSNAVDSCGTNCGPGTKLCLSLPDGTPCGCTYPNFCSTCLNAPLNVCPSTKQGRCGQSITCSPEPTCP